MLQQIIENAMKGVGCSRSEAIELVSTPEIPLLKGAAAVRDAHFGNSVQLCAIINAKNGKCDMDCNFCSQSSHASTEIESYPFMAEEKLATEMNAILEHNNCRCSVVTSGGKLSGAELDRLIATAETIEKGPLCASLGRLTHEELVRLKESGITRFHHNLESSEAYYPAVCTTQTWQQRYDTVRAAQEAGMDICSGGLFGLGESWDDRIDLAITLRDLEVDSVPLNFLYAHEGTPQENAVAMGADEALRIIAIYRLLLPEVTLRICGGRTHVLADRQSEIFAAGANGMMTGNYLTVAGSQYEQDIDMIQGLGLEVVKY